MRGTKAKAIRRIANRIATVHPDLENDPLSGYVYEEHTKKIPTPDTTSKAVNQNKPIRKSWLNKITDKVKSVVDRIRGKRIEKKDSAATIKIPIIQQQYITVKRYTRYWKSGTVRSWARVIKHMSKNMHIRSIDNDLVRLFPVFRAPGLYKIQ